jgi:hypothetical protein
MMKPVFSLVLTAIMTACISTDYIRTAPEDIWTWQVNQNYQRLAHCVSDALNSAPAHSWFYEAPRPITSFNQQWQRNRIILSSKDPWGVEQVRIEVAGLDQYDTHVVANAKNLEALGGGAPMGYVKAYVDACARGS